MKYTSKAKEIRLRYKRHDSKGKVHLTVNTRASDISRDFQGQIRGKIGQFRGIFAGKKSTFVEKSAHFAGFSREKSQNSRNNQPISRDFSGKKSIFEGFSGANS